MNRRSFLGALAVVIAAPRTLANVLKKESGACIMGPPFRVRTGLPPVAWRMLNEGVSNKQEYFEVVARRRAQLDRLINPRYVQRADGTISALTERNEVLDSMPWVDA